MSRWGNNPSLLRHPEAQEQAIRDGLRACNAQGHITGSCALSIECARCGLSGWIGKRTDGTWAAMGPITEAPCR